MLIMKETVPFDEPIGCVAKDTARPIFVKVAIPDYAITRTVSKVEKDRVRSNAAG